MSEWMLLGIRVLCAGFPASRDWSREGKEIASAQRAFRVCGWYTRCLYSSAAPHALTLGRSSRRWLRLRAGSGDLLGYIGKGWP